LLHNLWESNLVQSRNRRYMLNTRKRRSLALASVISSLALVLSGCSSSSDSGSASGDDAWFASAAEKLECKGKTIKGVTENTPPGQYVKSDIIPAFEAATGMKVDLETTSWDEMYSKAINDMEAKTGIYDFVYIEQDIIYQYLKNDYLANISKEIANNADLKAPSFDFGKFTSFINDFKNADGDVFGIPMEAFVKVYLYRTDLFNDPANQEAFKAKYKRDLVPATNYKEYQDIADFFTAYGKGKDLWGTTVQAVTGHPASFYELFESILPTNGVYNWGISKDFKASTATGGSMNSKAAKDAFAFWVGLLKDAPPESKQSTWTEVGTTFAAGRAAQGWVYGENVAWIATDSAKSKVVGKVGVALPPLGNPQVLADSKSGAGYLGYYDGGAFGVPASSKNITCSVLFQQYQGQESVQAKWAAAGSRIVMDSTYNDPIVQEQDTKTNGYYTFMKDQGSLFRGAPAFPFHTSVREVIAPFIYDAIAGKISTSDALDKAAKAADAEMKKLGY
jgi:multiple sugar transport system substrate-binding protein